MKFTPHQVSRIKSSWHRVPCESKILEGDAVINWCRDYPSDRGYFFNFYYWWFESEEDAMMFALKWGSR